MFKINRTLVMLDNILKKNESRCSFAPVKINIESISNHQDIISKIGGWFVDKHFSKNGNSDVFPLTPLHGRVACFYSEFTGWVLIKGVGWTYGGPRVLNSPKDAELCFGLYDKKSAEREQLVSNWLLQQEIWATRVLGYAKIDDPDLNKISFKNGSKINPVLLYTRVKHPLRIMDLAYFNDHERELIIQDTSEKYGWSQQNFVLEFLRILALNVALFHSKGGCNDTLEIGNVTLAAEITDFEWVSVPGVPLLWGDGTQHLNVRKQKEILYLYEIAIQLSGLLHTITSHGEIMDVLKSAYEDKVPEIFPALEALDADISIG